MNPLIIAIIVLILSAGLIVAAFVVLKKKLSGGSKGELDVILAKISATNQEISELLKSKDSFIGSGQFGFVQTKRDDAAAEVDKEKDNLKQIETKLDSAQKLVEQKEAQQQEIKAAKEEDLVKLQELLVNFDDINQQSVELEQRLAQSLKSLDSIMSEIEMTQSQKESFALLQAAVEDAGSRMRDLLTEYQAVNERLNMLRQQHSDLEEEYTRLVEQQLGE